MKKHDKRIFCATIILLLIIAGIGGFKVGQQVRIAHDAPQDLIAQEIAHDASWKSGYQSGYNFGSSLCPPGMRKLRKDSPPPRMNR